MELESVWEFGQEGGGRGSVTVEVQIRYAHTGILFSILTPLLRETQGPWHLSSTGVA